MRGGKQGAEQCTLNRAVSLFKEGGKCLCVYAQDSSGRINETGSSVASELEECMAI